MVRKHSEKFKTGYFAILLACLLSSFSFSVYADDNSAPYVARSSFSLDIEDREPLSPVSMLDGSIERVYFFTELKNLQDQIVTHRWYFNGEPAAEVTFRVKGPRWRVFSSKAVPANQEGIWSVDVLDNEGRVILTESIKQVL